MPPPKTPRQIPATVRKVVLPPLLERPAEEYLRLYEYTGNPAALLAWSKKIGEK